MTIPFKTSVITDEISQDLGMALELARAYHLDAIEVRGVWNKGPHEWSGDDIARLCDMAGAAGVTVCGVAPPLFKCELADKDEVARHLDILRRSCAAAHALNAPLVRGFAFWRRGPLEDVKDEVVGHLKEAARIAEGEGLTIALENEYSTCNCNVRRTLELIEAAESPALRLLYDPGNDVYDPEGENPWPDSYELAKATMVHIHLKDPGPDASGEIHARALGEGAVHVPELMAALLKDGYSGVISLETHYRRDPLPHETARLPQGEDFSAGGYVATRECLDNWFAILENAGATRAA